MSIVDKLKRERRHCLIAAGAYVLAMVAWVVGWWRQGGNPLYLVVAAMWLLFAAYYAGRAVKMHRHLTHPLLYLVALQDEFGADK